MSLSIYDDDELLDALGYSYVAGWQAEGLSTDRCDDAKRAWRAVPENWRRELELTRARLGALSRQEYLERKRQAAAQPEVIAERAARSAARDRAYLERPGERARRAKAKAAKRAAMPRDVLRAQWAADAKAYRDRRRAERERGLS